jgi:copper transport protein
VSSYLVSWRVASLDSHPVGGTTRFTVGEAAPTGATPGVDADESAWRWPNLVIRAAHYGLMLLAVGLALFLLILRPPPLVATAVRRWVVLASGLALATAVLRAGVAGLELALLSPLALLTAEPWRHAFGLPVGTAMAAAVLGLGTMLVGLLWPSTRGHRAAVLAAGTVVALLSFALTSHVLTVEPPWLGPPLMDLLQSFRQPQRVVCAQVAIPTSSCGRTKLCNRSTIRRRWPLGAPELGPTHPSHRPVE